MRQFSAIVLSGWLIASSLSMVQAQVSGPARSTAPAVGNVDPWPRRAVVQGATIEIYQPQLETWNGNLRDGFAAVTVKR